MFQCTEILGIYLDSAIIGQGLECCLLKKKAGSWVKEVLPEIDRTKTVWEQLRLLLQSLKPAKTRRICFGLSRSRVFLREISLPDLREEDAMEAVRLGIELHCHLEPDDVLFDIAVFKKAEGTIALLAYAEKSFLTHIFKLLAETDHAKSLWAISPASLGLDYLLRHVQAKFPCVCFGKQDEKWLLSMHGAANWSGSHLFSSKNVSIQETLNEVTEYGVETAFAQKLKTPLLYINAPHDPQHPEGVEGELRKKLNAITQNAGITWALCSAAIGLSPYPLISISEKPRKKPLHMRVNSYQLLLGVTATGLVIASLLMGWKAYTLNTNVSTLKARLHTLQSELTPLLEKQKQIDHLDSVISDTVFLKKEFVASVDILRILSAYTLPDVTVRSMNIRENTASLTVEARSAVEAMDKWRQMENAVEVKLASPVTKDQDQKERFSIDIVFSSTKQQQSGAKS